MDPDDGAPSVSTGNARQKFRTLKTRWGVALDDLDWKHPPEMIQVRAMDHWEYWKKWNPAGEPAKPDDQEYELVERRKATDGPT